MKWLVTLLVLVALVPSHARATCPTAWYSIFERPGVESPNAAGHVWDLVSGSQALAEIFWNALTGQLMARVEAQDSHASGSGEIRITDDFSLIGAPTGSPVQVTAVLEVDGFLSCLPSRPCTYVAASISDTAGHQASAPSVEGSIRLELPMEFIPGVAQRLTYRLYAYAFADAVTGHAQLTFPDLAPGMSIVSCGGFQTGAVTVTRPASWARLKQLYR